MTINNPSYKALAISSLCNALLTDPDSGVRCIAAEALGKIGSEIAIPTLSKALSDKDVNVRQKVAEALGKIGEKTRMTGDRVIHIDGGNYIESLAGSYIERNYINMSQDLTQAASQIQDLIEELIEKGIILDIAREQIVKDIVTQAQNNPKMKDKLLKWGQSLEDPTVSNVVKEIVKLSMSSAGMSLP